MNFGMYSYLATIAIFTGLAAVLYLVMLLYVSKKNAKLPHVYLKVIGSVVATNLIFTPPGEWLALTWRAWTYNPERTFHTIFLGAEVETYLFTLLVTIVVALATLVYARREDRKARGE